MNSKRKPPRSMKDRDLHLQCEWSQCNVVIEDTMDNFINHIKSHIQEFLPRLGENNEEKEYICLWKECGYSYTGRPIDLIRHLYFHAYHTKLKWFGLQEANRCKLNACQLDMQNRNLVPDLPEKFQCAWHQCMYHVDNPEYFYRHVEMHAMTADLEMLHDCTKGLTCKWEGCRISVKNKFKLREHLRSHTQERRYGCAICGGLFYNRTKFVDHLDRQLAIELQKFQCSHCFKTFSTERLLRDHMRCHVNHYKCPFCDMTCPSPSSLKAHIKFRHTEDKPYKCDLCDYSCKTSFDLRRHMNSHNAAVLLRCEELGCSYETKVMQSLRLHYKKIHNHEEVPRYLCHMCDSQFSRGGILTKHLKKKHKFKWPSGHSRFRYKLHSDGFHRLQTVRYESIELTEQLINERQAAGSKAQGETPVVMETEQEMDDGVQETEMVELESEVPHGGNAYGAESVLRQEGQSEEQRDLESIVEGDSYSNGEMTSTVDHSGLVNNWIDSQEQVYDGAGIMKNAVCSSEPSIEQMAMQQVERQIDVDPNKQSSHRPSVIVYHQVSMEDSPIEHSERTFSLAQHENMQQHSHHSTSAYSHQDHLQHNVIGLVEQSNVHQTPSNILLPYEFPNIYEMRDSLRNTESPSSIDAGDREFTHSENGTIDRSLCKPTESCSDGQCTSGRISDGNEQKPGVHNSADSLTILANTAEQVGLKLN